jgi:hypothetical protein
VLVMDAPTFAWPGGDEPMSFDPDTVAVGSGTDPEYVHPSEVVRLNWIGLRLAWLVVVDGAAGAADCVDSVPAGPLDEVELLDNVAEPQPAASKLAAIVAATVAMRRRRATSPRLLGS